MSAKKIQIRKRKTPANPLATSAGALAAAATGLTAGWILYSNLLVDHAVPLPKAIPAQQASFESKHAGRLNYYVDAEHSGRPLVLLHSVNAAASAYEMQPLFQHYRATRPVYALDFPGYGFSERLAQEYTPDLFAQAIADFIESQVGQPADVIALSLGCEFAARAALAYPQLFRSLTMISPSGFNPQDSGRASQKAEKVGISDSVYPLLSFPLWGRPLFDLIATRRSIEYFLGQSFVGPIPPGFVDYAYATSHQPGAEHVPLYFLSGRLFTGDILERVYRQVSIPGLILYDRDAFVRFDRLPELTSAYPNWRAHRISPSQGLPQFEKLPETTQFLETFWESLEENQT